MLKTSLFILSSWAIVPTIHAAVQHEDPVITAFSWHKSSEALAIGTAEGVVLVFELNHKTGAWDMMSKKIEKRFCPKCKYSHGITQLAWLNDEELSINNHIQFSIVREEVCRTNKGPTQLCFRCKKAQVQNCIYSKDCVLISFNEKYLAHITYDFEALKLQIDITATTKK